MSNGHICCLFGVCCPPGSQSQRKSFMHLAETVGITREQADNLFDSLAAKGAAITTKAGADLVWSSAKAGRAASSSVEEEDSPEPSDPGA